MPITAPPPIPLITDPSTFSDRAQAWVLWQANDLYPAVSEASLVLNTSTSSVSTTSNTIGTGSKTFTVETGKGYVAGQSLSIAYTTDPTQRMFAVVSSYNTLTGQLIVTVQAIEGSGTYATWSVALAFNGTISASQIENDAITTDKILAESVTYPKLQNVSATARILGRKTAAAGDVEECTLSEILDFIGSATHGDILYRDSTGWGRLPAGTSGQFLKTSGNAADPAWDDVGLQSGSVINTTAGTTHDWVIPAGVKQIDINLYRVSLNSVAAIGFRIGTGGTPDTTGYLSNSSAISSTANTTSATNGTTTGFLSTNSPSASSVMSGTLTLRLLDPSTNTWVASGNFMYDSAAGTIVTIVGDKSLSGELDIVRIYGGTFDGGKASVNYI